MYPRFRISLGLALAAALFAASLTTTPAAAQDCLGCDAINQCVWMDYGDNDGCSYEWICLDDWCNLYCLLAGGGMCEPDPEAVAMTGQVVLSIDPGSAEGMKLLAELTMDAAAGLFRQSCSGAIVRVESPGVASPPEGRPDAARPAHRLVLQ